MSKYNKYREIEESSPLGSLLIAFAIGAVLIFSILLMNALAPVWFRIMFYMFLPLAVLFIVSAIKGIDRD